MIKPESLCQIEIPVRDLAAGVRFYAAVFGWKAVAAEMHNYVVFDVPTQCPYGISLVPAANGAPDPTGYRTTLYFSTEDPDEVIQRAETAGGIKRGGPRPIPGYGTVWYFCDPDGNRFGLFQRAPKS